MTLADLNTVGGVIGLIIGGGGVWSYLASKSKVKVDLQAIVQEAAGEMITSLREEVRRLEGRCAALEAQDERCRRELSSLRELLKPNGGIVIGGFDHPPEADA